MARRDLYVHPAHERIHGRCARDALISPFNSVVSEPERSRCVYILQAAVCQAYNPFHGSR